ncbi:Outer membrane protein OmpA [Formivibrio citricus]|uniref:Outer membrane protein OmpA n=1 Tax=Formivibrio citricus TaxID=83765 RepID=A0A1I4V173_9NEIS|nr:OmpA family protein [Formivibrio citricus]SFM94891.1 Outer membrane protein OmpA [Formivibrio citricus]
MNIKVNGLLVMVSILLVIAGCTPTRSVILVPDKDGKIGRAEVTTDGGKQVLTQANDMTRVKSRAAAPAAVTTADPAYIAATFSKALAVEPMPAEKFVLYFETGKTELTAESRKIIATIARASEQRKAIRVAISGHTDAAGSDQLNDRLALERAELVNDLLQQQGIKPSLISVTSHGKGNPAVPTPDGIAEPRNRRVEVIIQ